MHTPHSNSCPTCFAIGIINYCAYILLCCIIHDLLFLWCLSRNSPQKKTSQHSKKTFSDDNVSTENCAATHALSTQNCNSTQLAFPHLQTTRPFKSQYHCQIISMAACVVRPSAVSISKMNTGRTNIFNQISEVSSEAMLRSVAKDCCPYLKRTMTQTKIDSAKVDLINFRTRCPFGVAMFQKKQQVMPMISLESI